MKRLPLWAVNTCYALASVALCHQLWRLRGQGITLVVGVLILALSFCLMKLSYIPFPRRVKVVTKGLPGVEPDYYPPLPPKPEKVEEQP